MPEDFVRPGCSRPKWLVSTGDLPRDLVSTTLEKKSRDIDTEDCLFQGQVALTSPSLSDAVVDMYLGLFFFGLFFGGGGAAFLP